MYRKHDTNEQLRIEQGKNGMVVYLELLEAKITSTEQRIGRIERVMKMGSTTPKKG